MMPDTLRHSSTSRQAAAHLRHLRATLYPADPLPNIIPGGGISLLAGASGVGKTAFMSWVATRFRDQLPLFGHQPNPIPKQALLAMDRSWVGSTSRWFELVGYADICAYSPLDDPDFKPARFARKSELMKILDECLTRLEPLPPGSLVYIDPLSPFLGGDLNKYADCANACMQIRAICRERKITILGTAHSAKQKADRKEQYRRPQDRILGTTAQHGYTDTQMYLCAPEEAGTPYYQFLWNPHHAREESFDLDRDTQTGLFIPPDLTKRPPEQLTILAILDGAEDHTLPLKELSAQSGLSDGTLARHLQVLIDQQMVVKVGRGVYALAARH